MATSRRCTCGCRCAAAVPEPAVTPARGTGHRAHRDRRPGKAGPGEPRCEWRVFWSCCACRPTCRQSRPGPLPRVSLQGHVTSIWATFGSTLSCAAAAPCCSSLLRVGEPVRPRSRPASRRQRKSGLRCTSTRGEAVARGNPPIAASCRRRSWRTTSIGRGRNRPLDRIDPSGHSDGRTLAIEHALSKRRCGSSRTCGASWRVRSCLRRLCGGRLGTTVVSSGSA